MTKRGAYKGGLPHWSHGGPSGPLGVPWASLGVTRGPRGPLGVPMGAMMDENMMVMIDDGT